MAGRLAAKGQLLEMDDDDDGGGGEEEKLQRKR